MTKKRHREYIKEVVALGGAYDGLTNTGSGHVRLKVTAHGKIQEFLIANSDSDRRAFMNWRARFKKWIKEVSDEARAEKAH